VVSFVPLPLYPRYPFYRRFGRPQSRSGRYGEVKNFYPTGTRNPAPQGRPAGSQSLYRLSISQKNCFLSQLVRFNVCEHQNKLNLLLRGKHLLMHELLAYTAIHLQNRVLLFSKQVKKNNFTHSSTLWRI
jgi:hypothetical protein